MHAWYLPVSERLPQLQVLVNNAGVTKHERTRTPDGLESETYFGAGVHTISSL